MLQDRKGSQAYGNVEVVNLLKRWLKEARKGQLCHVTVTACQMPNAMACDFAGTGDLAFMVPFALDTLKIQMGERARLATGPVPSGTDASYACYNLADSPKGFDFLPWLVAREMDRVREGSPGPLRVAFAFGQDGKGGLDNEHYRTMFANVLRPLVAMIGAVEDKAAYKGRSSRNFVLAPVSEAARRGEAIPRLKAPPAAMAYVKQLLGDITPITITLRELDVWKHRNSNLEAWKKFANELVVRGERVLFVRDTAKAGEALLGFETFPIASANLAIRMALYEQSKMNYFVPNGPWNLALLGSRPWRMFHEPDEADPYHCNRPSEWKTIQGIAVGEQFPWSSPDQRVVWRSDTFENLSAEL